LYYTTVPGPTSQSAFVALVTLWPVFFIAFVLDTFIALINIVLNTIWALGDSVIYQKYFVYIIQNTIDMFMFVKK